MTTTGTAKLRSLKEATLEMLKDETLSWETRGKLAIRLIEDEAHARRILADHYSRIERIKELVKNGGRPTEDDSTYLDDLGIRLTGYSW